MRLHATIPALYPHGRRVKGVARIRHVGCAHPGDTLTLARIRSSRHRCAHPSKRSNPCAHPVCVWVRVGGGVCVYYAIVLYHPLFMPLVQTEDT